MSSINHSAGFIRKRKFLLVLPALVLPFVIILFYLMGGGGKAPSFTSEKQTGLNLQLPDAHFLKKKEPDKLALYEASNKDSAKRRMALRNDPYRADSLGPGHLRPEKAGAIRDVFEKAAAHFPQTDLAWEIDSANGRQPGGLKEKQLLEKLNSLKEQLNKPAQPDTAYRLHAVPQSVLPETKISGLLRSMNGETASDPEMTQLDKMLDKLVAIQHPESLTDSLKKQSLQYKSKVFRVNAAAQAENIGCLDTIDHENNFDPTTRGMRAKVQSGVAFYGLSEMKTDENSGNAIGAIVPETQVLVSGSTVRLRIVSEILVNGVRIPKNEFLYGKASLENDRLKIAVNSIQYQNNLLPVSLSAYNLDGIEGLYIPGSISRDAGKQSANQAINGFGPETLDPSLAAQAAGAGIQVAKSLIGKKVKLVRVTVPAGYRMFLKDNNQK